MCLRPTVELLCGMVPGNMPNSGLVSTSLAELRSPETLHTVVFSHVDVKNHAETETGATFSFQGIQNN